MIELEFIDEKESTLLIDLMETPYSEEVLVFGKKYYILK